MDDLELLQKAYLDAHEKNDLMGIDVYGAELARLNGYRRVGDEGERNLGDGADVRTSSGDPLQDALNLGLEQQPVSEMPQETPYLEPKAVATGAVEGALVFPGMVAGAKAGAVAGAMVGPIGAGVGAVAGGAVGAVSGFMVGDYINEKIAEYTGLTLSDKQIENLPDDEAEQYYAFSMLGSVVSGAGATSLMAKTGIKFAANTVANTYASKTMTALSKAKANTMNFTGSKLNDVMAFAAKHPLKYVAAETALVPSTYVTGKVFADIANEPHGGARFAGEVAGSMLNPMAFVASGLKASWNKTVGFVRRTATRSGVEAAGSSQLVDLIKSGADDVDIDAIFGAIKYMRQDGALDQNVAILSGNPRLMAISKKLEDMNPNFKERNKAFIEETTKNIEDTIHALKISGNPDDLLAAANLEFEYATNLIKGDIAVSEARAVEIAEKLIDKGLANDPTLMMKLSRESTELFEESLARARAVESDYWNRIQHIPITENNIATLTQAAQTLQRELGREQYQELVSAGVGNFFENIAEEFAEGTVTTERLHTFRSYMLSKANQAAKAGDAQGSRAYTSLASAALADLEGAGLTGEAYQLARQVSYQLNETFTRSFLGKQAAVGRYGPQKSPELLLHEVFKQGDEAAEIALRDIESVSDFMDAYADPDLKEESAAVMGVIKGSQERMFKIMTSKFIDPETGLVDQKGLKKFVKERPILFDRFKDVKRWTEQALNNEQSRLENLARLQDTTVHFQKTSAFASVLGKEPIKEVRGVLRSDTPLKGLEKMVTVVKSVKKENQKAAQLGLRASILEAAINNSVTVDGKMNFKSFKHQLFRPHGQEETSVFDYLLANKIFDEEDVKRITYIIDRADNLDLYKNPGQAINKIETESDYILQQLIGGISATQGPKIAKAVFGEGAGGHSLLLASRSAGAGVRLFDSIPRAKSTDFMAELMNNPDLFIEIIGKEAKKGKFVKVAEDVTYRKGHAALYRGGFIGGEEEQGESNP